MEKGYIVLTPEKIEDIFVDLEIIIKINTRICDHICIEKILESKKQELLKSIKQ